MVAVGLDHRLLETAQERLNVQPTLRNSDAELLSAATSRLSQSYFDSIPGLHIDAEQGIVTISGRASNRSERMQHHSNASHDTRRAGRCRSHRLRFRCVTANAEDFAGNQASATATSSLEH